MGWFPRYLGASQIMSRPSSRPALHRLLRTNHVSELEILQTWKTKDNLPSILHECRRTWITLHPDARHTLVDHRFVWKWLQEHALDFPHAINHGMPEIRTIDTFRYCYMLKNGGLYLDLDFLCIRPVDQLLAAYSDEVVVGRMTMPDSLRKHSIQNSWMYAASPGHPLWLLVLSMAEARYGDGTVEFATGPVLLYDAISRYRETTTRARLFADRRIAQLAEVNSVAVPKVLPRIVVLPPEYLYPLSWGISRDKPLIARFRASKHIDSELIQRVVTTKNTYAFTYFQYSWKQDALDF